MKPASLVGALLVVFGLLALVYQGFTYTKRETVVDIGPVHATADEEDGAAAAGRGRPRPGRGRGAARGRGAQDDLAVERGVRAIASQIGRWLLLAAAAAVFFTPRPAFAYSVLSHEANIDVLWDGSIKPLLRARYPSATSRQIDEARAYAYGGCVIQDLGYYPFGSHFFSNLLHYVRSGDSSRALIRDAQDVNGYAFALGALGHYAADNDGHRLAVNRAVPLMYPKIEAKYGNNVPYERVTKAGTSWWNSRSTSCRSRRRVRAGRLSQLHRVQGREASPGAGLPRDLRRRDEGSLRKRRPRDRHVPPRRGHHDSADDASRLEEEARADRTGHARNTRKPGSCSTCRGGNTKRNSDRLREAPRLRAIRRVRLRAGAEDRAVPDAQLQGADAGGGAPVSRKLSQHAGALSRIHWRRCAPDGSASRTSISIPAGQRRAASTRSLTRPTTNCWTSWTIASTRTSPLRFAPTSLPFTEPTTSASPRWRENNYGVVGVASGVPVSNDDPANTWRPSASVTDRALATVASVLEWKPEMVTTCPGLSEFRFQPRRIRPFGGPSSKSQCTILPLSSLTSMKTRACGLVHSSLVTVPVTVNGRFESYSAANEWWAESEPAPMSGAQADSARKIIDLPLMLLLPGCAVEHDTLDRPEIEHERPDQGPHAPRPSAPFCRRRCRAVAQRNRTSGSAAAERRGQPQRAGAANA